MEVLTDAVAADGYRAPAGHVLPEQERGAVPLGIAREVGYALEAYYFGNLRVGVHAGQGVAAFEQRVEQRAVRESLCQTQISVVTRQGIDVGEHLVKAAVLADEHPLHLFVAEVAGQVDHPVGKGNQHGAGLVDAGHGAGVAQSDVVERHPIVMQVERAHGERAVGHGLPKGFASRHSAQIAVARGGLALGQLVYHIVEPRADAVVAGGGVHKRERRQIVTADVAVEAGALPVGIVGRLGLQAGRLAIGGQQTVGVETEEVGDVETTGALKFAAGDAHVLQREEFRVLGLSHERGRHQRCKERRRQ